MEDTATKETLNGKNPNDNSDEKIPDNVELNPDYKPNLDYQNNHKKPNKWIQRVITFLIIPILSILITWLLTHKNNTPIKNTDSSTKNNVKSSTELSKSNDSEFDFTDSDGDGLPDWVEKEMGTDPSTPECKEFLKTSCGQFTQFEDRTLDLSDTNIFFLLDSSGSMAATSVNGSRMDIAKSSLAEYVDQYNNTKANVGLIAFGHKGSNNASDKNISCSQVEEVYPIGAYTNSQFISTINNFQPVGWTPIASALELAGQKMLSLPDLQPNDKNIIVLITDGEETCGGNPSAVAKKLNDSGLKVVVNVIALDTTEATNINLKSIATSGGGEFLAVNTSNRLKIFDEWRNLIHESDKTFREWLKIRDCLNDSSKKVYACYGDVLNQKFWPYVNEKYNYLNPYRKYFNGIDPNQRTVRNDYNGYNDGLLQIIKDEVKKIDEAKDTLDTKNSQKLDENNSKY